MASLCSVFHGLVFMSQHIWGAAVDDREHAFDELELDRIQDDTGVLPLFPLSGSIHAHFRVVVAGTHRSL